MVLSRTPLKWHLCPQVPDYATVIKTPMDLSTVLANINSHRYSTSKDFVHDVDLIWKNALEYNPDTDPES